MFVYVVCMMIIACMITLFSAASLDPPESGTWFAALCTIIFLGLAIWGAVLVISELGS